MDLFCEQVVKIQNTSSDKFKKILMIIATLLTGIGILFVIRVLLRIPVLGFVLACVIIYIGFYFVSNTKYEFEYIVTNGDIDVDKIIAKRKRKRLLSTSVKSFTAFGKLDENTPQFNGTIIKANDNIAENSYYAEFKHNKHGNVRLIFSPDDKTLEHIKPFISRTITK